MQITIYTIAYNRKMNNQRQNIRGIGSEPKNDKNFQKEIWRVSRQQFFPGSHLKK